MSFFKYCGPKRMDMVECCRVRFTPASEFNDPFECLPDAKLVSDPRWQRQIEESTVREMCEDTALRRVWPQLSDPQYEAMVRTTFRERYAMRTVEHQQLALAQMLAVGRAPLQILCLSELPPDAEAALLMWGHYTDNHRGFVVEFDRDHQWIRDHRYSEGQPHNAGPVVYSEFRPGWDLDSGGLAQPRDEFVFTKSPHWSYEREYRLIRVADPVPAGPRQVVGLYEFPRSAIRSVTMGVNINPDVRARLRAACYAQGQLPIQLRAASIHPDEYKLVVNDCVR